MRKFSAFTSNDNKIKIQNDSLNHISAADLKKYLKIADKFLSNESKEIINYLIVNNSNYISELGGENDTNALASFYNNGIPSKENLKELWKNIETVVKSGRILEIPVFQNKTQFEKIINKTVSPDFIICDLDTEYGRNQISIKYQPLVHKICRQYHGKSSFTYDDLLSAANEALTNAMNTFGKGNSDDDEINKNIVKYTFLQYAAYMIRFGILDAINRDSRIVRIAKSEILKTRKEQGEIAKTNTISGDSKINSEDGNKTVFDMIDSQESDSYNSLNDSDLKVLWSKIHNQITKEFGKKIFEIWCSFYGINDFKKLKNKELAKKYKVSNSSITYYCTKVNNFLQQDPKTFEMLKDVFALMKECLNEYEK